MFDLHIQDDDGVARLHLNAPQRLNALRLEHWAALAALADNLAADDHVTAVVISGAGDRAFCAGGDITEFSDIRMGAAAAQAYNAEVDRALVALAAIPVPTIARIHQACFGGGSMIALSCDLRFAAPAARFCIPPAKMGFAYNALPLDRLRQLVGPAHALDLVYTARTIDAAEAVRIGLVNDVADDLDGLINQRLSAILEHAPLSHRAHKRVLNEAPEPGSQAECAITDHLYDSQDYQEAVAAFTERRRPTFKGQ